MCDLMIYLKFLDEQHKQNLKVVDKRIKDQDRN